MKKLLKALVLSGVILCLLLVLALLLVDKRYLAGYLETWLVKKAREREINISINRLNLGLTNLSADSINAFVQRPPLSLSVNRPKIELDLLSLITLTPKLEVHGDLYKGTLRGSGAIFLVNQKADAFLRGTGLMIAEHPQLAFLSLKGGLLDFELLDCTFESGTVTRANGTLSIRNLAKPQPSVIPRMLVGTPFDITIPAFSNFSLKVIFLVENGAIKISDLKSASSLFDMHGSGTILPGRVRHLSQLDGFMEVRLRPSGKSIFGPWLPVISSNRLGPEVSAFRIEAQGLVSKPVLSFHVL